MPVYIEAPPACPWVACTPFEFSCQGRDDTPAAVRIQHILWDVLTLGGVGGRGWKASLRGQTHQFWTFYRYILGFVWSQLKGFYRTFFFRVFLMLYFILLPFYTLLFVGFVSCKKKKSIYIYFNDIF